MRQSAHQLPPRSISTRLCSALARANALATAALASAFSSYGRSGTEMSERLATLTRGAVADKAGKAAITLNASARVPIRIRLSVSNAAVLSARPRDRQRHSPACVWPRRIRDLCLARYEGDLSC